MLHIRLDSTRSKWTKDGELRVEQARERGVELDQIAYKPRQGA